MKTKVLKCNCKHEMQDKMYGGGNRVCNQTKKGPFRCTICEKEQSVAGENVPEEKQKTKASK